MPGIRALRKIQLFKEVTAGTPGAATTIWRGLGTIEDQREVTYVEEDIGYISGQDRTFTAKLLAALAMEEVPATFEQLPHILNAGVKLVETGVADGAGSGKIYTYTFPTTAKNTIRTYTLEGGDDQEAERMEYAFVDAFALSGAGGEALMMSADWIGRQVALNAFAGGATLPTVEDVIFSLGKLFIDAIGGTIGTTLQSNTLLGMTLNCKTGWVPVFAADGNKFFSFHKITKPEVTIDLTFEHDAVGAARKVDWRAETARLFRIQFEGSTLATPGTSFTKKTIRIDCASKIEKVSKLDEADGNDILTVTLRPRYNATAARFLEIAVINELATLP
jgi:hypothetical protein